MATNATVGISAARMTGSAADATDVGVLGIDAQERQLDLSLRRIRDSSRPAWKKAWDSYLVLSTFIGKSLWRIIGGIDTVTTSELQEFIGDTRLNQQMRRQGLDPQTEWEAFMSEHQKGVRYAVDQLGLTPNQAAQR